MVHHLERTDSKDRVNMFNDHDSLSSGEAATGSSTCPGVDGITPTVEIDHCSETSSSQKDSDSPPSSPSEYKLLQDTTDKIITIATPECCMHLLIDRMNSSSSTANFLKKTETDPSLSLSDEGEYAQSIVGLRCSASVAMMIKSNDIRFVSWNWPKIRLLCTIFFWSLMTALLAMAVGLVVTAPKNCLPSRQWWQGATVYEIFPAAFQDTDHDGLGDIEGITKHLDYIQSLGVTVIRLNSIFESETYPTRYWATLNHTNIASHIGTVQDFEELVNRAHQRGLKVVMDFNPIFISKEHPLVDPSNFESNGRTGHRYFFLNNQQSQFTDTLMLNLSHGYIQNKVDEALEFWLNKNVDGFYMKYIEHIDVTSQSFQKAIYRWRSILDRQSLGKDQKILICSGEFADRLMTNDVNGRGRRILENFDLLEYDIEMDAAKLENLPKRLQHGVNNTFGKASPSTSINPWIMWSVGSAEKSRLATRMGPKRSMAAIIIHLMLPGSVNLFYGDEMHLEDSNKHTANWSPLVPMRWLEDGNKSSNMNLTVLKEVTHFRNISTPLLHSFLSKNGDQFVTANYRIRLWQSGVLVLERFYPRWNSVVVLVNLNETAQQLDISSLFYQGKVVITTHQKAGEYVVFNNVKLRSGEVLITEI
ncbi:hypothetical protein CHUAL_007859 [Chamberlinius hualienensis]